MRVARSGTWRTAVHLSVKTKKEVFIREEFRSHVAVRSAIPASPVSKG